MGYYQLAFEFAAVLAGAFIAFQLDRLHDWRATNKTRIEFLNLIQEEIEENFDLLDEAFPKFRDERGYMPTQGLRVDTWHALSNRITLVKSTSLRRQILTAYAKFDMYERTLSHYLDLGYTALVHPVGSHISKAAEDEMRLLALTICAQLNGPPSPGILDFVPNVVGNIHDEVNDC